MQAMSPEPPGKLLVSLQGRTHFLPCLAGGLQNGAICSTGSGLKSRCGAAALNTRTLSSRGARWLTCQHQRFPVHGISGKPGWGTHLHTGTGGVTLGPATPLSSSTNKGSTAQLLHDWKGADSHPRQQESSRTLLHCRSPSDRLSTTPLIVVRTT